jgi:hypothetical protein
MSSCTGVLAVPPSADFRGWFGGTGAADQVGDVQGAVLVLYQRGLEPGDFDALHLHLLRQQRQHRHRHACRIERGEFLFAAGFGKADPAKVQGHLRPQRKFHLASDVELALLLFQHYATQLGLQLFAVEQCKQQPDADGDQRDEDTESDTEDAQCFHADFPFQN